MITIELNLDDDFSSTCAWHICEELETISRHYNAALEDKKLNRWVYMGIANTYEDAHEYSRKIRQKMCEASGKIESTYEDKLIKIEQENEQL
jgi:hypothetical protein